MLYTPHDRTLYSVKMTLANATESSFRLLGHIQLEFTPKLVRAIKQKQVSKVLLYDDLSNELQIYPQNLTKKEV